MAAISTMAPIASLYLDRGWGIRNWTSWVTTYSRHLIALRNNGLTNRRKEIIKPSRKCEADQRVAGKVLKRKNNTPQQPDQQRGQKAQPQQQKRFKHVSNATWQGEFREAIRLSASGAGLSVSRLPRLPAGLAQPQVRWSQMYF